MSQTPRISQHPPINDGRVCSPIEKDPPTLRKYRLRDHSFKLNSSPRIGRPQSPGREPLLDYEHTLYVRKTPGGEPVEVDAACKICGIEPDRFEPGRLEFIHKRSHLLSQIV